MTDEIKTYVNLVLDEKETKLFEAGKEKTGIRGNADFVRYLINAFAKDEK